jgi:hypothetical protein
MQNLAVFIHDFSVKVSQVLMLGTCIWFICTTKYFDSTIILTPRVLCKMQACRARGVLILPEWESASFGPLICSKNRFFKPFVFDYLIIFSGINFYQPCKNGSGSFGIESLKFRMFAPLICFNKGDEMCPC